MRSDKLAAVFYPLRDAMLGYCLNEGVYEEDVDDVLQEVWVRIMRGLHTYDPCLGELGAWFMGCLRHTVGDYRRERGRDQCRLYVPNVPARYLEIQSQMEDEILEKIDRERLQGTVRRILHLLSPRQERLITRHYLDEVMWKDVAVEEGITKNAAIQANIYGLARLERTIKSLVWPEKCPPPRTANHRRGQ